MLLMESRNTQYYWENLNMDAKLVIKDKNGYQIKYTYSSQTVIPARESKVITSQGMLEKHLWKPETRLDYSLYIRLILFETFLSINHFGNMASWVNSRRKSVLFKNVEFDKQLRKHGASSSYLMTARGNIYLSVKSPFF